MHCLLCIYSKHCKRFARVPADFVVVKSEEKASRDCFTRVPVGIGTQFQLGLVVLKATYHPQTPAWIYKTVSTTCKPSTAE